MSSQKNTRSGPSTGLSLKKRLLGLGALGGAMAGVAAVVAMTTAVGGVVLANSASTSPAKVVAAPKAGAVVKAASATAASTKTVMIENYAFSPAALTIKVGDTVTWTNMDTAPHTVTVSSGPDKFASPNLQKGQSFSYTFTKAGTYHYYCAVHPDMTASVTVTGAGTTTPTPTATPTATATADPTMPMPTTDGCDGAETAINAFLQHLYAGHLEPSLGQQVSDITDVDQYVKTHTVLIENMLKPLIGGGEGALNTFLQHVYSGHLEPSLGQQVSDITNVDQYVKTHTVLIESMLKQIIGGGSAC